MKQAKEPKWKTDGKRFDAAICAAYSVLGDATPFYDNGPRTRTGQLKRALVKANRIIVRALQAGCVLLLVSCEDPIEVVAQTLDKQPCKFSECRVVLPTGERATVVGPMAAQDCVAKTPTAGWKVSDCRRVIEAERIKAEIVKAEKAKQEAAKKEHEPRESIAP